MSKIALLFPGQGSQYVGMGKDLCGLYPSARNIFDQADNILGFNFSKLCFHGPDSELNLTENAQPAVLTVSIACLEILKSLTSAAFFPVAAVAGHSLGEYTALVASGSLEFSQAVKLVRNRGRFMKEAAENNPGGMTAVIGLDRDRVEEICGESSIDGDMVTVANLNCPGQIVVSGTGRSLEQAEEKFKQTGAGKVVRLAVSGPFHSSLMESAAGKLADEMKNVEFKSPDSLFLPNVEGDFLSDTSRIKELLIKQIDHPVLWEDSVRKMLGCGITQFMEIGPGKVLTGLLRRIDKTATAFNIGDEESLKKTIELLGN